MILENLDFNTTYTKIEYTANFSWMVYFSVVWRLLDPRQIFIEKKEEKMREKRFMYFCWIMDTMTSNMGWKVFTAGIRINLLRVACENLMGWFSGEHWDEIIIWGFSAWGPSPIKRGNIQNRSKHTKLFARKTEIHSIDSCEVVSKRRLCCILTGGQCPPGREGVVGKVERGTFTTNKRGGNRY